MNNVYCIKSYKEDKEYLVKLRKTKDKVKKFERFMEDFYTLLEKYKYRSNDNLNKIFLNNLVVLNKIEIDKL